MKRIIYTLACLMLSVGAWAQTSLQEQINNATDGATITLTEDVTLTKQVEVIGKNITIDLNGKTISYSGSDLSSGILLVHNGAGLTINATNGGAINSGIAMAAIALTKKGDDYSQPAKLVVNGGTITGGNFGITGNGTRPNTDITINGGTITATVANDNFGIYHPQDGKLTITGGTITAYSAAIEMRAGTLDISGGTFTSTATGYSCNANGSGTTTVGAAIAIAQHTTKKNINVSISGGTFTGVKAINESNPQANDPAPQVQMLITDGTFTGEISTVDVNGFVKGGTFSSAVPEDYCASGYIPTDDGEGHYGVKTGSYVAQIGENKYESLAEAISAAQNGEKVTLLADVTDNITIPAGKNITLDLNGKTLSGGSVASNGKKAAIVNNGTIVIQDSSAEHTGTIKREDDDTELTKSNSYYVIDNQGTMTIKSGSVTNKAGVPDAHKGSSLIRNGEVEEGAVLNIEGGTLTQDNFDVIKNGGKNSVLNITGGTINSANSYAILSYDAVNMTGGEVNGNVCFRSYSDEDGDSHGVGNITGGTINGNITVETYPGNTPNTLSECNISGAAVINGTLSIGEGNGKTFTANDENGTIAVSGGTFANPVPEQYCAEGFSPVTTPDSEGMYTVETTKVAMIGDARYASLEEAVEAATDGAIIKLIGDGLKYEYVEPNKVITLDLNGFSYDCNIDNYGTLTIVDNSEENTGKLVNTKKHWIVWNNPSAKLTVQSGTIAFETRANAKSDTGQQAIANEGSLIINGGTIDGYTADYNTGIADSYTDTYAVENISGDVTINGGKLMGLHSLSTFGGTSAVINDGQFIVPFGPGTNAVYNYTDDLTVYIKGGTFIGDTDYLINKNDNSNGSFCITGGKFYKYDPQHSKSENPIANFVPKEYAAQKDADGYYVIVPAIAYIDEMGYAVLDIAIEEAKEAESATTITLLTNAETEKETLPANVTINANGKELTMPSFVVLDGQAFTLPNITGAETYKVRTATYKRTNVSSTVWGTVCLPFSLTSGNGATYYTFDNISGSTLTVNETTSTVAPNTPVVFHKAAGDLEINEENATVSLVAPETLENGALVGIYEFTNVPAADGIYFINGDTFHKAQVSVKVPAYRAYINNSSSSGAKPSVLSIMVAGNTATSIETLDADATVSAIYDASGRKISAPQKGMNIMKLANGKTVKVMIK